MSEAMEKLRKSGEARWAGFELDPAHTALLVVDMQRYFLSADSPFSRFLNGVVEGYGDWYLGRVEETVVPNLHRLLQAFRGADCPVLWTRVASQRPDGSDLSGALRRLNERASASQMAPPVPWIEDPWAAIRPDLEPAPGERMVDKTTYGSFASTDLQGTLKKMGITSLVLCGVVTNVCVETSAREAVDRGLSAVIVHDGCAAFSPEVQEGNLMSYATVFGPVRSTDEVIEMLQGPGTAR